MIDLVKRKKVLVAGGLSETVNGRGGRRKTSVKGAAADLRSVKLILGIPMPSGWGLC